MSFPFCLSTKYLNLVCTLTLDEAIAYARNYAERGREAWQDMTIHHDDGRSWTWEIKRGKPHLVEGAA